MRQRLLWTLLWLLLLPLVGLGRLLWTSLRLLGSLRPMTLLVLAALAFALSLPSPLTAAFRVEAIGPEGYAIASTGTAVFTALVLTFGLRSRWLRRLWRRVSG